MVPEQAFIEFDSYVVVFDPSTVIQARQLLAEIRVRTSKPVRYVVISHFHPDHSAGAAVFAATGAEVVAAAAARLDFDNWVREDFAAKLLQQPVDYRGLTYSPPTRCVENTWVLDDGKQRLELTHFGHGHTSGDLVGWMPKPRILLAGDLSTDGYLNLANANMNGWIAVLDKLRALQPRLVMRGHGHLGGPEALEDTPQDFFGPEGRIVNINGQDVQVFEYENKEAMESEASQVAPDGGSVGTSMMMWMDAPHFYKAGRILVLYIGSDEQTLTLLQSVIGAQFAGR